MKTDYIRELSEVRMVRRAPEGPFELGREDRLYVLQRLRDLEIAFGIEGFPGVPFEEISGRELIGLFIDWWRGLEPETEAQQTAHGRLPGAIRLLDTHSALMEEKAQRPRSAP
ncbi:MULTISPECIES: hypothetical protein [Methylosinus]|uniref:Uncharacterized protein n=1 Tax=Methylosinus trichosporium (strain ATCC 35070 / NCIMB 11131 / UNIQEM 75 / OB3b) TaxID=595536 RepID=A0A2D2CZ65_METT3|nr:MULTISPECIES: hypothetical protein [Methylosinus]ATQ68005.1 hypothetical protein CQW49_08980 [Methylosinus trichosporium OB3b]